MAPGANSVSKDGWSCVSYGWTCCHCGLEQVVPAMRGSEARRRSRLACCSSPGPKEEQKARHTANAKAVHPARGQFGEGLGRAPRQRALQGFGAAMQAKMGKLTRSPNAKQALQRLQSNLRSRPSKVARLRWRSRRPRSPSWKRQPSKQPRQLRRPIRRRRNCKGKSTSYRKSTTRSWLALSNPGILSHISRAPCVRRSRPFQEISKPSPSSLSWKPLSQAFPAGGCNAHSDGNRCARRHRLAAGQREGHLERGNGRRQGFRAFSGRLARGRARGQEGKYFGVRREREAG